MGEVDTGPGAQSCLPFWPWWCAQDQASSSEVCLTQLHHTNSHRSLLPLIEGAMTTGMRVVVLGNVLTPYLSRATSSATRLQEFVVHVAACHDARLEMWLTTNSRIVRKHVVGNCEAPVAKWRCQPRSAPSSDHHSITDPSHSVPASSQHHSNQLTTSRCRTSGTHSRSAHKGLSQATLKFR
jgi:hypothetical protein